MKLHSITFAGLLTILATILTACVGAEPQTEEDQVEQENQIVESTAEGISPIVEPTAYLPQAGNLCQATENIQFYAYDYSTHSYVVQKDEYIRIDRNGDTYPNWTEGHGSGHSTRPFIYRHSNGTLRLKNCH
ncbi:MAG TPA: hypothetical protein PK156_30165 [Polyangium sp.]|nr:hypothetical protein [Polyangium sp.]